MNCGASIHYSVGCDVTARAGRSGTPLVGGNETFACDWLNFPTLHKSTWLQLLQCSLTTVFIARLSSLLPPVCVWMELAYNILFITLVLLKFYIIRCWIIDLGENRKRTRTTLTRSTATTFPAERVSCVIIFEERS